jgi:hypothetical protein
MGPLSCVSSITCSLYPSGARVLEDEERSSSSLSSSEEGMMMASVMPLIDCLMKKCKSMPRVNVYMIFL